MGAPAGFLSVFNMSGGTALISTAMATPDQRRHARILQAKQTSGCLNYPAFTRGEGRTLQRPRSIIMAPHQFTAVPHEFNGQRVLVTGGTKGVGRAVVVRMREACARLLTTTRKQPGRTGEVPKTQVSNLRVSVPRQRSADSQRTCSVRLSGRSCWFW
jgi:hypothetical protein